MTDEAPPAGVVRASVDLALDPPSAFDVLVDELSIALARSGIELELRPGGSARQGDVEIGRVVAWQPGERLALEWRATTWEPEVVTHVELTFERVDSGTRIAIEQRGFGSGLGDGDELAGWFAGEVVASLLGATSPAAFGEWLTDRRARRPSGGQARETYRDPLYHRPNFVVLLELLALEPDDVLLEIGCGGGAFLHDALESGCSAAAIDHSPDMVRVARETNATAVAEGRLEVIEATAERLPFPDDMFTSAAMTGVLGFLSDPVAVFAQIRRVLADGGRLVVLGSDPAMRGTPAAPEPMASRLRFYDDEQLAQIAHAAAFSDVQVIRRSLAEPAREAGIPDEHLPLFEEGTTPFLVARKPA